MAQSAESPTSDVRERIIEQATRLFARRGYDGTSIQAVSEAAGITRPTLVYHFGNKEALRTEVLERLLTHWKQDLPRIMESATSGGDRFQSAVYAVIGFFAAEPRRAQLIVREMMDRPKVVQELFAQHLQPWTALVTGYIRAGQAGGSVRRDLDPEAWVLQLVTAALATVAAGTTSAQILSDPPSTERQLRELVRIGRCSLFNPRPTQPKPSEVP